MTKRSKYMSCAHIYKVITPIFLTTLFEAPKKTELQKPQNDHM